MKNLKWILESDSKKKGPHLFHCWDESISLCSFAPNADRARLGSEGKDEIV